MVRVGGELVVGYQVARDGLAVVRAEELGGCVPELSRVRGADLVELVLELDVALGKQVLELGLVAERGEVEGLAGREDGDLLGEVAVVGVVEAVCSKVRKENRMSMSRASSFYSRLLWALLCRISTPRIIAPCWSWTWSWTWTGKPTFDKVP